MAKLVWYRMKNPEHRWLRSSRVERATHNRLVTGSNPVGANFFCSVLVGIVLLYSASASAQSLAQNTGGVIDPAINANPTTGNPAAPQSQNPNPGTSAVNNNANSAESEPSLRLPPAPYTPGVSTPFQTAPAELNAPPLSPDLSIPQNSPPDQRVPGAGTPSGPSQKLLPPDTLPLGVDQFAAPPQTNVNLKGPSGEFLQFVDELTYNKPCLDCTGVQVRIKNDSSAAIIVDAEKAASLKDGKALGVMSEDRAMAVSGGMYTKNQKLALGAAALGTLGLAEPILQDHFSTSKKDFPVSYGVNETRRRLEDRRLGKRIILPGEDTDGILFFPGDEFSFDKISIPIQTYPQGVPVGTIDIVAPAGKGTFQKPMVNQSESKKASAEADKKQARTYGHGDPSDNSIKDMINSQEKERRIQIKGE